MCGNRGEGIERQAFERWDCEQDIGVRIRTTQSGKQVQRGNNLYGIASIA